MLTVKCIDSATMLENLKTQMKEAKKLYISSQKAENLSNTQYWYGVQTGLVLALRAAGNHDAVLSDLDS